MDEYLHCLYQYVLDHLFLDARMDLVDYNRWETRRKAAWKALSESLTEEQMYLVEDYQTACGGKQFLEDELLFQKAVALGKWMALER